jgi:1-deoxy-D-xylulose-5-phosphate reductoisomerase
VIGATGSIGRSAADVAATQPDRLRLVALAARARWQDACALAQRFGVEALALEDEGAASAAAERLAGSGVAVLRGAAGVAEIARWPSADVTLAAATGIAGLPPVLAALRAGKDVALANKESLVAAGRLVSETARLCGARLLPVDGEHCGVFQCLHGRPPGSDLARLWLTASGGPFRAWDAERIARATPDEALRHPVWPMGRRITVDSASLMNKGFEVIEAAWLFGLPPGDIRVVVHPQGIVHALIQFVDGAFLAQCSHPDMRLPIAYALGFPDRWPQSRVPTLDPTALGRLDFEPPDERRFPCLRLAYDAAERGRLCPAALNGADEVAVERFLRGEIAFGDVPSVLEDALARHDEGDDGSLDAVLAADGAARARARAWARRVSLAPRAGRTAEGG